MKVITKAIIQNEKRNLRRSRPNCKKQIIPFPFVEYQTTVPEHFAHKNKMRMI